MTMWLSDPTPLITAPVIPVLTIERAQDAVPLARALLAGGLTVVEVTLRTPAALEAVRAHRRRGARRDRRGRHGRQAARHHACGRRRRRFPGQSRHVGRACAGAGRRAAAGHAGLRHRLRGDDARRARLSGAEVLPGRGVGRRCAGSRPWPSRCPTSGSARPAASTATTPRPISRCRMCSRSAAPGWRRRKRSRPAISPASPPAPGSASGAAGDRDGQADARTCHAAAERRSRL